MNRRTFFGALVGGTVSSRIAQGKVRDTPDKFITRFTLKTKFGDYFFYWTGWKRSISTVVNVGQWIAEPAEGRSDDLPRTSYEREHPAFYAATTGAGGALVNMNYIMDLTHKEDQPLITDKSSADEKWDAQNEALDRLIKSIEDYELPPIQYVSNSHTSWRDWNNQKPGSLVYTPYRR